MKNKYILFISYEFLLIVMIVLLGYKIFKLKTDTLGTQIVNIDKNSIQFDLDSSHLKYFYEPIPKNIKIENPDWLGHVIKNTINTDSLNERYDYPIAKDPKMFRIIILGDSHSFGLFVNTTDNYSEKLEDLLNNKLSCSDISHFEVINLGVGGYDLEYSVERFIKRGIQYDPDLVIWLVNEWNFLKINEVLLPKIIELEQKGTPRLLNLNGSLSYFSADKAINEIYSQIDDKTVIQYQTKVLIKFSNFYKGNLIFSSYKPIEKYIKIINNFISKNNKYILFDNLFKEYFEDESLRFPDNHPNEKAYQIVAERIFKKLLDNTYFSGCKYSKFIK